MKIITDSLTEELLVPMAFLRAEILIQDKSRMSVFDCFDRFQPEYIVLSSRSLNSSYIKNISERPHLKTIIINEGGEKLEELKSILGNSFLLVDKIDYYNPVKFKNIKRSEALSTDLICINAHEINNIEKYYPSKNIIYRIFSNRKVIENNNYCGVLRQELEPVAIKSSKISIVKNEDRLNSIYAGSVPVLDPLDVELYLDKDLSEIIKDMEKDLVGKSNFEQLSNIFLKLHDDNIARNLLKLMEDFS